ncbi:MAG: hypothetical protein Q8R56_12325 [Polaromonas sp.]|nr:hypothetical protein [Polaromonas sp.]
MTTFVLLKTIIFQELFINVMRLDEKHLIHGALLATTPALPGRE